MVGWVGANVGDLEPHCYADADLGGCVRMQRSTAGAHLVMRGPNTCFPIAAGSKRMGCVVLSTADAELYVGFFAIRMFGRPALTFWSIVLQREDIILRFHEDNQTMIRVLTAGRNFSTSYAARTARLPIAWLHERFKAGAIDIKHGLSARMAAGIDTKACADPDKWLAACWLIRVVGPAVIANAGDFVITEPEKPNQPPAGEAPSPGGGIHKPSKGVAVPAVRVTDSGSINQLVHKAQLGFAES